MRLVQEVKVCGCSINVIYDSAIDDNIHFFPKQVIAPIYKKGFWFGQIPETKQEKEQKLKERILIRILVGRFEKKILLP